MPTDPQHSEPGAKITIDRAALKALRAELYKEREARDGLQRQLNRETEFSRRAAEETLVARDDRERFRRLMAVGLANEHSAVAALSKERERVERLEKDLAAVQRERGQAEGRASEMEQRIERLLDAQVEALAATAALQSAHEERLLKQAEHHRQNSAHLTYERGLAQGASDALRAQVPPSENPTRLATRKYASACFVAAAICGLIALILLPATLMSLFAGERPEYLRLALGVRPGVLLLLLSVFIGAAYVLSTRALSDLRGLAAADNEAKS